MAELIKNSNKKEFIENKFKTEKKFNILLELLFKTSIFLLIGIIISKVFSYLYKIIIARYLGADLFGLYSLSLAIVLFFAAVCGLGISEGVLRFISFYRGTNQKNKIRYIFRISYKILIISTISGSLLLFFLSDFISVTIFKNPNMTLFIKIFSLLIPIWVLAIFFINIMIAFEKIKQQAIIEKILQSSAKLFFLIFFIFLGLKTNAIIFSFFLGVLVFFLSGFLYCKYKLPDIFISYNLQKNEKKEILKNLFSYSIPLMLFWTISSIFYWSDSLMIGFFKNTYYVGVYNAAIPIASLLVLAPELFIQLFFPIINKEYARKNILLIKRLSKKVAKWIFIINFPAFFLMMFFPGTIINFFFGEEYLSGIIALRFLLIGNLFFSLFIISDRLLSMAGKTKILLMDLLIVGILNIILNFFFIPKSVIFGIDNLNGITGASIATAISMIIFNLILMIHGKYYTSIIPLNKDFIKIFYINIIPISILLVLKSFIEITTFSMILITITFFSAYILLLFLMNGLDKNDFIVLKTLKDKFWKNNHKKNIVKSQKDPLVLPSTKVGCLLSF